METFHVLWRLLFDLLSYICHFDLALVFYMLHCDEDLRCLFNFTLSCVTQIIGIMDIIRAPNIDDMKDVYPLKPRH